MTASREAHKEHCRSKRSSLSAIGKVTSPGQSDKHKYPLDNEAYLLVGLENDEG